MLKHYLFYFWQFDYSDGNVSFSSEKLLQTGVLTFGQLLFVVHINDLQKQCSNKKISLFVHDTTVYKIGKKSENPPTEDAQAIINWFIIKTEKFNSIYFRNDETIDQAAFGENVTANASCKHLEKFLDRNFNFKRVNYVTKKLNKVSGLIYKIRECFPRRYLILFFDS